MRYQPNYCCHCGEKIERPAPSFTDSKMFCDVCKHDFVPLRIFPLLVWSLLGLTALFGVGSYWRGAASKPLNISTAQLTATPPRAGKSPATEPSPTGSNSNGAQNSRSNNVQINALPVKSLSATNAKKTDFAPPQSFEAVYFCGAATKKGAPCSRRVRGGGRCWQHKGSAALLPDEKLLAGQ